MATCAVIIAIGNRALVRKDDGDRNRAFPATIPDNIMK
ncbi:hypothetical protein RLEG12_06990 (plasmid) [Rhizobium leguminosarum bv. trifolii CB782]|nr:hypothetical protein RLEG12_06990 [Rhizobium leguminosarum bv. trifolii CB782]EJC71863.1 hypothetical protein Rleg10DRAFT_0257 [Rhizobium leguminosarum bv. trifolii WSM2012]